MGIAGRALGAVIGSGIDAGRASDEEGVMGRDVATGDGATCGTAIAGVEKGVGVGIGFPRCRFGLGVRTGIAFLIGTGRALRIGTGLGAGVGEENAATAGAGRRITGSGC